MPQRYCAGDIIELRKPHPCGSNRWEILRTGADFRLRCLGCGHLIWLPRAQLEKQVKVTMTRAES
ncbi:MAG: DUF951 domain-containing protein [Clostridia bacterium]|nr:MAG: DUF951 domain-containing protein [Clostridia bacterium]